MRLSKKRLKEIELLLSFAVLKEKKNQ